MFASARGLAERLGSVRLTVLLLLVLAGGVLLQTAALSPSLTVAPVLGGLALNLFCAILTNRRIRTPLPLLGLHIALLLLLLTLLAARLTYFDGQASVSVGAEFEGTVFGVSAGALHRFSADRIRFSNDDFVEQRKVGDRFVEARNQVSWRDSNGVLHQAIIGDGHPLDLGGYRIHVTPSRGVALFFEWADAGGQLEVGSVQLPDRNASGSFKSPRTVTNDPPEAFTEAQEWRLPNGTSAWVMLERDAAAPQAALHGEAFSHRLVIHLDGRRAVLAPGEFVTLPQGRLTYLRAGSWVGYRIVYDALTTWILASGLMVVFFMAWFYWSRFGASADVALPTERSELRA